MLEAKQGEQGDGRIRACFRKMNQTSRVEVGHV